LNNPLIYTDPSGEWFIIEDWIIGGIRGLFNGKGFIKGANEQAMNAIKIWGGLFKTDSNEDFKNRSWQLISRFTWEVPQTVIGLFYSLTRNTFGCVDRVDYFGGATFATNEGSKRNNGLALGNYININNKEADRISGSFTDYLLSNPKYMHEYGHYIDSQIYGLSYLFVVGVPSLFSAAFDDDVPIYMWKGSFVYNPHNLYKHDVRKYEMRANKRAAGYFKKYYGVDWSIFRKYPTFNPF